MKTRRPITPALQAKLREIRGDMAISKFANLMGLSQAAANAAISGESVFQGTRYLLVAKVQEITGEKYEA
jgi:hypothetical protein